ncbi:MAG TPA: hypothetical protein VFS21_32195 [Roseiflexaceae bacterium]|nr:hypothetical protein [Roseiflexaceae bacterium]
MAHARLNHLVARTLALLALLSGLALPGARPASATPALAPAKAAADEEIPPPDTLVAGNIAGFTVAKATVFWYTQCRSGQPTTTDSISRIPVQGGESHQLYNVVSDCSSSTFQSNVVADTDYLYWASNSGLLRLSTNATVGDQPQVLSAAAAGSRELVLDNDVVYTLHVTSPSPTRTYTTTVQQVAKAGGTTTTLLTRTGNTIPRSLQVSHAFSEVSGASDYLYWLDDEVLMRYNLNNRMLDTIARDVNSFYAEGGITSCENLHCTTTDRVYFSGDEHLSYYNNDDGTTTHVYGYQGVYVVGTNRRYLFLIATQTINNCAPRCSWITISWFTRAKREAPGTSVTLHNGGAGNITTVNGYLLWQSYGQILRLPADVGLPHLYMPVIRN